MRKLCARGLRHPCGHVRPPAEAEISAPEFPPRMEWLGVPFRQMDRLLGQHAVLVEFWDFARVHSLRTLPYLRAWHERYAEAGLAVIGVHSPGYSFGRDRGPVERAVERLEVPYPVVLDPDLQIWRLYGNRGWPGRYLFDRTGLLRFYHYGEGEYLDTELAIQECLGEIDDEVSYAQPLEPLRPEDAPGVLLRPQTADVALPGDRHRLQLVCDWVDGEDWIEASDAGAAATFEFSAGGAYAVLSGGGVEPGLYETEGTVTAAAPGLRLHGVQFTPEPPGPSGSPSEA
ncbi:MAG TPA: redoxin domain-containing protein [Thermoleophilaceae bacterium]|nr:redoxin domain-containing protein [Thermoleophilaceae bacterium]